MVTKQPHIKEPPALDEAWWAALLAEEYKHSHPASKEQVNEEALSERGSKPSKFAAKSNAIDWKRAQNLFTMDETISLQVTGFNRGGLLVGGSGLHGFVPVSHLLEINCQTEENEREAILSNYVGRTINFKVIECDPERGRVVFSERAALAESGKRNLLFGGIHPGDRVYGVITNITEFGVFVDLGGVEGLIHVSELSWGRVRHPADVVKISNQVLAYVIQIDQERSRIALSLKRLSPNPWETAEERYRPGQVVNAMITSIVPFGAFARLEEGLDGLIHSTELGADDAQNGSSAELYEGQMVKVRVLNVDASRQRLGLSLNLNEG
jgi:small subunit ribosomal protein S1